MAALEATEEGINYAKKLFTPTSVKRNEGEIENEYDPHPERPFRRFI
jgi:hypothetical protein